MSPGVGRTPQGEVTYTYDAAGRRTQLTLPNGIVVAYTYDQDSRVTGMTWTLASNQIGDLSYAYGRLTVEVDSGGTRGHRRAATSEPRRMACH